METLLETGAIVGLILLFYSALAFIATRVLRDNGFMDVMYGPAFFVSSGGALYITDNFGFLPVVIVGCIALWSTRLSIRIFRKNFGQPEDARYAAWRKKWLEKGRLYFWLRSYLQVNLLQCLIIGIVAAPAIIAISFPDENHPVWLTIGFAVFLFGLAYETIADWQLDQFITRKKLGRESSTLMQKGLFKYSRRPNYFGETMVWWGLAIMVLPLPFGYLAVISPLFITYIVTCVTGPILEDAFLKRYPEEYREYMDTTNYFLPGSPRS